MDYNASFDKPAPDPQNYIDVAPEQHPVVVNAASAPCVIPGKTIAFDVSGGHSSNESSHTYSAFDGNGDSSPDGATRLYFGLMDGYQWRNNGGALSVDVKSIP